MNAQFISVDGERRGGGARCLFSVSTARENFILCKTYPASRVVDICMCTCMYAHMCAHTHTHINTHQETHVMETR